jgi:hypothetical protein
MSSSRNNPDHQQLDGKMEPHLGEEVRRFFFILG